MTPVQSLSVDALAPVRRRLGEGRPFGHPERIRARAIAMYQFLAEIAADRVGGEAGKLLSRLAAPDNPEAGLLHDPVLRRRLDDLRAGMVRDRLADWKGLRASLDPVLAAYRPDGSGGWLPQEGLRRLTEGGVDVLVDVDLSRPWMSQLHDLFLSDLTPDGVADQYDVVAASDQEAAAVGSALDLLRAWVPEFAESIAPHFTTVVVVDGEQPFFSASTRGVPSVLFISRHALTDQVTAAEAVLHEGIHTKLYDMYVSYSILGPRYDKDDAPHVRPAWHGGRENWPFDRALAAFQVYTYLSVFFAALAQVPAQDQFWQGRSHESVEERARTCAERARLLGADLLPLGQTYAGPFGRSLIEWLAATPIQEGDAR